MTRALSARGRDADHQVMASLPAISSFSGRKASPASAAALAAQMDAKLTLARRLRAEDAARRTTSVAPPSARG